MCDKYFVMCDAPTASLKHVQTALTDFERSPGDRSNFERLDWAMRVAMAKWEIYCLQRRLAEAG